MNSVQRYTEGIIIFANRRTYIIFWNNMFTLCPNLPNKENPAKVMICHDTWRGHYCPAALCSNGKLPASFIKRSWEISLPIHICPDWGERWQEASNNAILTKQLPAPKDPRGTKAFTIPNERVYVLLNFLSMRRVFYCSADLFDFVWAVPHTNFPSTAVTHFYFIVTFPFIIDIF